MSLKIAAGNFPSSLIFQLGGWDEAIISPLNGGQTPTLANFATLADALSGCVARVADDACAKTVCRRDSAEGRRPDRYADCRRRDRRYPWCLPKRVFALFNEFYPVPAD